MKAFASSVIAFTVVSVVTLVSLAIFVVASVASAVYLLAEVILTGHIRPRQS